MTYPLGGLSGVSPCCCPPPPVPLVPCPPKPEPAPKPCPCPPRVYRNPPDVEIVAGRNIDLQVDKGDTVWKYTVSSEADKVNVLPGEHIEVQRETTDDGTDFTIDAVQFPVKIDGDSADVLYGDGTPNNPLGVYDFAGATEQDDGKPGAVPAPTKNERNYYLKGDGTWSSVDIPEQVQSDWNETSTVSPAYILNKPDIDAKIDAETRRAKTAEAAATTEVKAGDNTTVSDEIAPDGHHVYKVSAEAEPQVQADWVQDNPDAVDFIKNKPDIAAMIGEETERAKAAESELSEAITAEKSRAETAEAALDTELNAEVERATAEEQSLEGSISAETERATAAEVSISEAVATEIARAEAAESELSEAINTEKSRAETAEESLGQSVSALETRATDLETRVTVLEGDVDKLEEDLSDLSEHVDTELAKKEDKSNKVASWQSVPDDTHYPTEKLVFDTISDIGKPLVWKGPKTVSELNDPSSIVGLKTGWAYTLTDRGALNDGTLNVEPGDEVAWTEDENWFKVGSEGVVVFKATKESGVWAWPSAEDVVAALSSNTFVVIRTADDTVRYYTFTEAGEGSWVFTSGTDSMIELNESDGTYSWSEPRDIVVARDGISVDTGSTGTTITNTDHVYKETVEGTLDGTVYTVNVPDDTYALVEVPLTATELVVNVGEAGDGTTVSESYFQFTLADGSVLDDILVKQNGAECLLMGPMSYPSKVTYQGRVVNGIATIIGYSPVFYNKEWIGAGNGVLLTAGNGVKFAFHNKEV